MNFLFSEKQPLNWAFPILESQNNDASKQLYAWKSLANDNKSSNDKIFSKLNISMPNDPKTPSLSEKILLLNSFPPSNIFILKIEDNDYIDGIDVLTIFFHNNKNNNSILSASILEDKPNEIIIETTPDLSDSASLKSCFDFSLRKLLNCTMITTDSFAQHFASFFFCSHIISTKETFCCRIFDPHLPFYYKNDVVEVLDANLQNGKAIIRLWPRLTYSDYKNEQIIPPPAPFDPSRIPSNTKKKMVKINFKNDRVHCYVYKDMKFNGHFLIMKTKIANLKSWSAFIPNEEKNKFEELFDESDTKEYENSSQMISDDSSSTPDLDNNVNYSESEDQIDIRIKCGLRNHKKIEGTINENKNQTLSLLSENYNSSSDDENSSSDIENNSSNEDKNLIQEAVIQQPPIPKRRGRPPKNRNAAIINQEQTRISIENQQIKDENQKHNESSQDVQDSPNFKEMQQTIFQLNEQIKKYKNDQISSENYKNICEENKKLLEENNKYKEYVNTIKKNYVTREDLKKIQEENKNYLELINNYQKNFVSIDELKKIKDESRKLKDENQKIQAIKDDMKTLKDENKILKDENQKIQAIKEDVKTLKDENKILKDENKILKDENQKIQAIKEDMKTIKDENNKLKEELATFTQSSKKWEKRAKEVSKENEDLRRSLENDYKRKNKVEIETSIDRIEDSLNTTINPKKFSPGDSVLYKKPLPTVYCHVLSSSPGFVKIIPVPRSFDVSPNDIMHKQIPYFKDEDPYVNRQKLAPSDPIITCDYAERPYLQQHMLISIPTYGVGIVQEIKDNIIHLITTDNQIHNISVENPFNKVKKTKYAFDSDASRIFSSDEVFYEDVIYSVIATYYDMVFISNKEKQLWTNSAKTTLRSLRSNHIPFSSANQPSIPQYQPSSPPKQDYYITPSFQQQIEVNRTLSDSTQKNSEYYTAPREDLRTTLSLGYQSSDSSSIQNHTADYKRPRQFREKRNPGDYKNQPREPFIPEEPSGLDDPVNFDYQPLNSIPKTNYNDRRYTNRRSQQYDRSQPSHDYRNPQRRQYQNQPFSHQDYRNPPRYQYDR